MYEPAFTVRVAGLPMSALERLRSERTAALVEELLELEDWLAARAQEVSDQLHALIGEVEDLGLKRRLITLRRDVFHGRRPKRHVPAEAAQVLDEWQAKINRVAEIRAEAPEVMDAEAEGKRRELRALSRDHALLNGLMMASEDLYLDLSRWKGRDGQLARRLIRYVGRMAVKTSPYSTFTGTAEGRWSRTGPIADTVGALTPRGVVELNAFTQQQIRRTLATWPEIRPYLPLRVNDSLLDDGGVLRFLGRRDGEAILELPANPTLQRLLKEIRDGADRTYGGVVRGLAAAEAEGQEEQISRYLDKLIDIGLVTAEFDIPDTAPDQLALLARALEPVQGERAAAMRETVTRLRADLAAYPRLDEPAARYEQGERIRRDVEAVYEGLAWAPTFPKNAFYEDTVLTGGHVSCSAPAWRGAFDALDLTRRLAGLYDRFLPGRLAGAEFFAKTYGEAASVAFLDFYRDFCREIRRPSGAGLLRCYEEPYPVPQIGPDRLAELGRLQKELIALVARRPVTADGTRHLDAREIEEFTAALPGYVEPIPSMAFYCQATVEEGRPRAVLNELTSGFGRSRARLRRLAPETFAAPEEPDEPYVEIGGTAGSNLNLRHPVTAYEIGYPGSVSERPAERRVAMNDLVVRHDPETGMLRLLSRRLGRELEPVHLGLMVEFLLPPAYRFLVQMFGQTVPRFEFVKELASASPYEESGQVRRHPRLCLGDVVLNRAMWTVPSGQVPTREKGEAPFDHLLRMERWRRGHGIPGRFFVRAFGGAVKSRGQGMMDKSRKPLFVDLAIHDSLHWLDRLAGGPDRLLVIEELLPGSGELVLGSHTAEFVFEVTGRSGHGR
jgi:hypothetical protein